MINAYKSESKFIRAFTNINIEDVDVVLQSKNSGCICLQTTKAVAVLPNIPTK